MKLTVGVFGDSVETPSHSPGQTDGPTVGYPELLFREDWIRGTWLGVQGVSATVIDTPECAMYPGGDWSKPLTMPQDPELIRSPHTYFRSHAFAMANFDFVIMRFGLNDVMKGIAPGLYQGALYQLGWTLQQAGVCHVMLCGSHCPAVWRGHEYEGKLVELRVKQMQMVEDVTNEGFYVLGPDFATGLFQMADMRPHFAGGDAFHPVNEGHRYMADTLMQFLPGPCDTMVDEHVSLNQYSVRGANHCVAKGLR